MYDKSNVYVITGGAGGMGKALAQRLGKRGKILLSDIDSARLNQTAAQLRSGTLHIETQTSDVADRQSVRSLAKTGIYPPVTYTADDRRGVTVNQLWQMVNGKPILVLPYTEGPQIK